MNMVQINQNHMAIDKLLLWTIFFLPFRKYGLTDFWIYFIPHYGIPDDYSKILK